MNFESKEDGKGVLHNATIYTCIELKERRIRPTNHLLMPVKKKNFFAHHLLAVRETSRFVPLRPIF